MNKMYTLGTHVQVVTDHQPLIPIYNSPNKPKQLHVDRHRTKLLPFQYDVVYEPGKETPCDYGSCHPPECAKFNEQQIKEWWIETGTDIYVNRVLEEILPQAITLQILRRASSKDKMLQLLISYIKTQNKSDCKKHLKPYYGIFDELTEVDGVILRGSQIVIPESLQTDIIGLAHEGHQYAEKTLQLLRQTCWFPGMRKQVFSYVESCLPCNAAQAHLHPFLSNQTYCPTGPGKGCMQISRALSKESITYMSSLINTPSIWKLIWLLLQVSRNLSLSWTVFLLLMYFQNSHYR